MTDSTRKKIIKWFWIVVTFPVLLLVFMILLVWMFADIPSFKDLENPDNKLATQVIADDGEILTTFHIENRTYVSYDEISLNLVHAAVATEDVRFYKHSGIDFKGLGRVLVKTILLHTSSQGGAANRLRY
uniref:transglycosylase domain-containing protein n=1 Tax=Candidatus Cryptobacteroides bacterium TaxID=3085639 RepID=UPI004026F7A4